MADPKTDTKALAASPAKADTPAARAQAAAIQAWQDAGVDDAAQAAALASATAAAAQPAD